MTSESPRSSSRTRTRSRSRARSQSRARSGRPFSSAAADDAPASSGSPADTGSADAARTGRAGDAAAPAPAAPLVREPAGGTPELTTTIQQLLAWCDRVAAEEDLAVDVERASSYRYSAKAYLIQVRSESAGTVLVDPLAMRLPRSFVELMNSRTWVLHAARQDLPSLAMDGMEPAGLFDTEVAGRLLGLERVGLGAVVEEFIGVRLAKEHSASNWSKRPLPTSWLAYAALDVEYLLPLRDALTERLLHDGKWEWALQEFHHEMRFSHPEVPDEPWRSLSGVSSLRSRKQLAIARALWTKRDEMARTADIAPFMVVRDKHLMAMVKASMRTKADFLAAMPKGMKQGEAWWQAARAARALGVGHLPETNEKGPHPHHKSWARKHPEVQERYRTVRERLLRHAEEIRMPVENLISPGQVRQWVWNHETASDDTAAVRRELEAVGARPWQAQQVAPLLQAALPRR
ncbi:HRDC domain-containing protein [Helcobacillus massiliensis]|uniref:HRDC domain-containing protein n=1 Tax=Helcobacillus massiliensis TaxID=521392 RepID=UPI0021A7D7C7|nr:HRDC domain-containing protein [Helcobacillus massiliensis]MCT1557222.1 HRDC domain-containing protein [Helcobacillus massiliensis]MCT2036928.1 HRDC domain-containing protein [Helcobacillus massiliensis]MCT2332682.1 HRDC domain-containing protein [Helcobacillus massiliensis]